MYKYLGIKGGEINIYRWGAAGAGAIYCESRECVAELMKKAADAGRVVSPEKDDKKNFPRICPEKVSYRGQGLGGSSVTVLIAHAH